MLLTIAYCVLTLILPWVAAVLFRGLLDSELCADVAVFRNLGGNRIDEVQEMYDFWVMGWLDRLLCLVVAEAIAASPQDDDIFDGRKGESREKMNSVMLASPREESDGEDDVEDGRTGSDDLRVDRRKASKSELSLASTIVDEPFGNGRL